MWPIAKVAQCQWLTKMGIVFSKLRQHLKCFLLVNNKHLLQKSEDCQLENCWAKYEVKSSWCEKLWENSSDYFTVGHATLQEVL